MVVEHDPERDLVTVVSCNQLAEDFSTVSNSTRSRILAFEYALESEGLSEELRGKLDKEKRRMRRARTAIPGLGDGDMLGNTEQALAIYKEGVVKMKGVVTKKRYKPVAQKVRPVVTQLPGKYRIVREIQGNPLEDMPVIEKVPPSFKPTGRYTEERKEALEKAHPGFLWEGEMGLLHHFMMLQNEGFAWTDEERGRFKSEFFPPIDFPVIPHVPYIEKNIPIPPGIYDQVCGEIKRKIAAGVYEPSNAPYRTRWFCVLKKDKKALRIVHGLELLNKITIRHSGVPPIPEHLAEQFAGRSCGATLDLYVGYDERLIAESSRDLTTFQTPFGALRLVTLPMGWTGSVPIFHDDVTYILQEEVPHWTIPYIDDVPVKGPVTRYMQVDGTYETIPENSGIRRFVWEHFQTLNRIVQRMKYSGGTFSGHKLQLCVEKFWVIGHCCTFEGRIPDETRVSVIVHWGQCFTLGEVRAFLGTVGVLRIYVRNFAHRAHALVKLTRKDVPFEWGEEQERAQEDLKEAVVTAPALRPLDYTSNAAVIVAVDTSWIAVGFFLCQCSQADPKQRIYNRFGSITLNDREARFSQPKLEIYGLFRALRALRLYIIGVRNLVVETDARYIKGMLANPDIQPSASINRWIVAILTFHFELVHVKGTFHGPDGLSRRPRQPGDPEPVDDEDEFDDWIDQLHGFVHIIQPIGVRKSKDFAGAQVLSLEEIENEQAMEEAQEEGIPRSNMAEKEDERVEKVKRWHQTLERPQGFTDAEYISFMKYATGFFLDGDRLWRKDSHGAHQLFIPKERRIMVLRELHDNIGHRRFYATRAILTQRFWWPHIRADIIWFVRTCHICQVQQTTKVLIPPVVATPAPLFAKVYMDTMHMTASGGYKYIVQGRCSLIFWPEFRMLRRETAKVLGEWIFEDILCRWGALREIVTDNGAPFVKALEYLRKRYHITHIRISGYNSRANGMVERSHFDVRQALYKAADGNENKWSQVAYSVFWAERVTVRKRMGCSPYYAATGTHPLLPLDIVEATYLLPPPESILSTGDLIVRRAIALQKRQGDLERLHSRVFAERRKRAIRFEKVHMRTIKDYAFERGDLVLMRNTAVEKSLNRKMKARYLGPLIVLARNKGGAYILCELDGSVLKNTVGAFRLVPYFPRRRIAFPEGAMDVSTEKLREMELRDVAGDEDEGNWMFESDENMNGEDAWRFESEDFEEEN